MFLGGVLLGASIRLILKKGEVPSYDMPVLLMMGWSLIILSKYCINKKHMSEHVLPFLLGICAPLVKVYSML